MKNIAIYCGASLGAQSIYQEKTKKLAIWMIDNQYGLVYGGGAVGLMGVVADTIIEGDGKSIGVMPHFLEQRELAHRGLDELILVEDMHERKRKMIELSDAFIALPGGPGTLEEISEVISWGRIGQHKNPCVFYNINGFYNPLITFFDSMIEAGFLTQSDRNNFLFTDSLTEIREFIDTFEEPTIRTYKKGS
ncbi:TIGR00730 family Rossman fold protein [Vagococcus fluvialis]|uniref:LOG family protein n=1 Tax=Vagococcus fluvialis TaxID=2738 RepID=UPI003B59FF68